MANRHIAFRNIQQAALWEREILGQLSDGHWENTQPQDHWKYWHGGLGTRLDTDTIVAVNEEDLGRNFYVRKDNYQLNSTEILKCIGGRMLAYAIFSHLSDDIEDNGIVEYLQGFFYCELGDNGHPVWAGLPQYPDHPGHDFWIRRRIKMREALAAVNMTEVELLNYLVNHPYGMKALRADLTDMMKIIRIKK